MEGGSKIILVVKVVSEQRLIAIGYIPSVTHDECLNVLDNPGWNWYFSYFLLVFNHPPVFREIFYSSSESLQCAPGKYH